MELKKPIFLTGFPGTGKTTFGRALSRTLSRDFIDLDRYIEGRFMRSVTQIFAEKGEEEFRRIEREMLHEAGEMSNVVVACGGGTPCFFDNADYMNRAGTTVLLSASRDRLIDRLARSNGRRPLLIGLSREQIGEYIDRNLAARQPYYSKAAITFSGEELEDRRQIDSTVARFLAVHPNL